MCAGKGQKGPYLLSIPKKTSVQVKSHIRYGYGLDEYSELTELACDLAIFDKAEKGGMYTLKDVEKKIRGTENVIEYLKANPTYYELIKNEVYEMSGVECR